MGLFSFLKNAGSKLFGGDAEKKAAEAAEAAKDNAAAAEAARLNRINVLTQTVVNYGIPVQDLSIDLNDDVVTVYGTAKTVSDKEKVILMLGNTDGIATVDDRMSVEIEEDESDFYVVKSGDSLSKIAKEYYGDMMKYPVIFEANKPMLEHPDLIYPGQTLRIPKIA
jgi:nucleoid-associated protein YgaU